MPETSIKSLPSTTDILFALPDLGIGEANLEVSLPGDEMEDLFSGIDGLPTLTLTRQHGQYFGQVDDLIG